MFLLQGYRCRGVSLKSISMSLMARGVSLPREPQSLVVSRAWNDSMILRERLLLLLP
jgi:hypothetical protein